MHKILCKFLEQQICFDSLQFSFGLNISTTDIHVE